MSLRTCHGRRGAATLALGLAGLMLVSCTPTGVGGLPARPLKAQGPVLAVPMSLTASDGTGLKLVSLKARAVVEEPLAFTELHLVFENPTDRTIEGRFEINMPPNAAISRFAMQIYGQWQEGEVVERRAAQVAFEDALHRKQDPALLENKAGNAFSARVFPILPRERKELIVSYSQELPSSAEPYRLPLRGLPELADLDASVILREPAPGQPGVSTSIATTTQQTQVIELRKQQWTPDQDLEVRSKTSAPAIGLRHANLAVARVAPAGAMPAVPVGGLTVLFDTSASRALDFDRQLADLAALLKSLQEQTGEDFTLRVVAFDQSTAEIYAGPASGFGPAEIERISTRRALGASDLRRALAAVALGPVLPRVLVISDGVATAGPRELAQIEAAARALASAGVQRIDAIVDGGIQDASTLKALTTADLAFKGVVADGRLPRNLLAHKLASATLPDMKVSVPGAAWVWPDTVEGAQPGDELLVYADLPDTAAMKVVLTGDATIETSIAMTPVERPLLERAWVGARIARLTDQRSLLPVTDRDGREALQKQVIEISTKFRVLSDFTALLVLESEWDYARFKIDRNALSDIMTVGPTGVALQNRKSLPPPQLIATREPAPLAPEANTDEEAGGTGQRHKGEEGKMGKPSSESKSGLYAMKGPKDAIPQMARNFDPAAGHGILAIGNDDADVWGGLTGTEVGEAYGVGGLGLVGTGRGGGGTGEGTISLGNTGLIGKGGGSGSGYGRGAGAGFGGRGTRVPTVRQAKAEVVGALDKDIIRRIVRAHINEVRYCYNQALARDPNAKGRVAIQFTIGGTGKVPSAVVQDTTMKDAAVGNCIAQATRRWTFPKPTDGNSVIVLYPFVLEPGGGSSSDAGLSRPITAAEREQMNQFRIDAEKLDAARARDREIERVRQEERDRIEQAAAAVAAAQRDADEKIREAERASEEAENARTAGSPYSGKMFDVMEHLKANEVDAALALALRWREEDPGDVLALVALGEALEAAGDPSAAARAYGSIIDLFPARADLRRYVGGRLERLGSLGLDLAIDTFAQAVEQRPDHPASHRLYAFALAKAGRAAEAFAAIRVGLEQKYPGGRFAGVDRILLEDAGLLGAAWLAAEPSKEPEIRRAIEQLGARLDTNASLRFVLTWETDANDVDFHVIDGTKERAWYAHKTLVSGGELFADVTTGYGPECFAIPGKAAAFPYTFQAQYFSRGPMGYGMGKLQIVQHDGSGGLKFDDRPFVIMKDRAYVELGKLERPL
ncbi:MAG: AgmX/PglI C-terminal domain-containing protein [Nannocystis sp.]|uniref:AgmX/PglI C-terminal domain-containing protein n=1 Tax=Nannocystis sp. TaxID=1962667 RepID=UPI0024294874|nr:AgmX/PglI C-terminal domain-containing protein [Nannocystis sp.]MBK9758363.1 AgmX/PglI C-terminal domain-containing protein [Nannocystis sp.]